MIWWQGALLILGLCLIGALAGFVGACVTLKIRGRPLPRFLRFKKRTQTTNFTMVKPTVFFEVGGEETKQNTLTEKRSPVLTPLKDTKEESSRLNKEQEMAAVLAEKQARIDARKKAEEEKLLVLHKEIAAKRAERQAQEEAKKKAVEEKLLSIQREIAAKRAERSTRALAENKAEEQGQVKETPQKASGETVVRAQGYAYATDALSEIQTNLIIASRPWEGKLIPFHTAFWDTKGGFAALSEANIQKELSEVYSDIQLANRVVWLSTDLGHRSKDLDDNYQKLCSRIAGRLERVKLLIQKENIR